MNNIELLLKQDIEVRVRMNMDDHNQEDLFNLTEQLVKRFDNAILTNDKGLVAERCVLTVFADDLRARKFYEKMGYVPKNGIEPDDEGIIPMEKFR